MCRFADYIGEVFGPKEGQLRGYDGHQEIELALVKLYRATGQERYMELSRYFLEERGQQPNFMEQKYEQLGNYELPNDTVYAETCASIGLVFFAHSMLQIIICGVTVGKAIWQFGFVRGECS